jgi:hypothetical protein
MPTPDPERQVQFLFDVQRLISDGSFVATYKFALLLALADLAVERGDDTTESLPLDTRDLAEKFVELYWRQVLPWVPGNERTPGRLAQARGQDAAVLKRLAAAHAHVHGSLPRLRRDKAAWNRLLGDVARTIEVMPSGSSRPWAPTGSTSSTPTSERGTASSSTARPSTACAASAT